MPKIASNGIQLHYEEMRQRPSGNPKSHEIAPNANVL